MSPANHALKDARDDKPEDLARKEYLEGLDADYVALRRDRAAWAEFREEAAEWEVTNWDGLERC